LPRLDYLRHRAQDRLSVALLAGEDDPARVEGVEALAPYLSDLGVRTRAWLVPKLGHELPSTEVLEEILKWLAEDLKRRREDVKDRPSLAGKAKEVPTDERHAAQMVDQAEADLAVPTQLWRGVALLEGVVERYGRTDAVERARARLKEVRGDARRLKALGEQRDVEDRKLLAAQARYLDHRGDLRGADRTWQALMQAHPDSEEAKKGADERKRLAPLLARAPYLGLQLEGETSLVRAVTADGPAARAGVRPGDRLLTVGETPVKSAAEVGEAVRKLKAGDRIAVEVQRDGKEMKVNLEVGTLPLK
jgi:hypothetical protein